MPYHEWVYSAPPRYPARSTDVRAHRCPAPKCYGTTGKWCYPQQNALATTP